MAVRFRTLVVQNRTEMLLLLSDPFIINSLGALLLSGTIVHILLPYFSGFVGHELSFDPTRQYWLLPVLGLTVFAVALLSGTYPALILSSFKPMVSLKGPMVGKRKSTVRNALVVVQFTASAALVISTLVISQQLKYIQNKDMGYRREQILIVDLPDPKLQEKLPVLRQELNRIPEVQKVSIAS